MQINNEVYCSECRYFSDEFSSTEVVYKNKYHDFKKFHTDLYHLEVCYNVNNIMYRPEDLIRKSYKFREEFVAIYGTPEEINKNNDCKYYGIMKKENTNDK